MRILVIGAGAIGGYFGARLLEAGRDVTFLVRPKRAEALAKGLSVRSKLGDIDRKSVVTVTSDKLDGVFDVILLSCKAHDLNAAISSFEPAVGPNTAILPLLNGMRHIELLNERFGMERVLGGQCMISATLDKEGRVVHLSDVHVLTFGEQDGSLSERIRTIDAVLSGAKFVPRLSDKILQEMWEKWVFIATTAGITCLMRGSIGDIVAAGAAELPLALFEECSRIATSQGFSPGPEFIERTRAMVTMPGSSLTASMLRDIEQDAVIEADHVLGDLLRRVDETQAPLLRAAYKHAKVHEHRRKRESMSFARAS